MQQSKCRFQVISELVERNFALGKMMFWSVTKEEKEDIQAQIDFNDFRISRLKDGDLDA